MAKITHTTKHSENSVKMAQLKPNFFTPENFNIKNSSPEISEIHSEKDNFQSDFTSFTPSENTQKNTEETEVFSVKNTFMIRQKRDMQNYVNSVANDMEVEKQDMQKVLLSYSKMMLLNEKIEKQKELNQGNPYGLEEMKRKVIEDFVRQQTEANVSYKDINEKQNKKNARNNRSSTRGKNGRISRTSQKKKKKTEKMSITKKALYWALGGTSVGFGFLT